MLFNHNYVYEYFPESKAILLFYVQTDTLFLDDSRIEERQHGIPVEEY